MGSTGIITRYVFEGTGWPVCHYGEAPNVSKDHYQS